MGEQSRSVPLSALDHFPARCGTCGGQLYASRWGGHPDAWGKSCMKCGRRYQATKAMREAMRNAR